MHIKPESSQEGMEALFPNAKSIELYELVPAVSTYDDVNEPVAVSFLYKGNDFMLCDFRREDENGAGRVEVRLQIKTVKNKPWKDLRMKFDFIFKTGHPMMETYISGENQLGMRKFIDALYRVNVLYFFLVNEQCRLEKLRRIPWEPTSHFGTLEEMKDSII